MMNLYTVVRTPDGRTGLYVGGWFKGQDDLQEVVFQDGSMWRFREAQLRQVGRSLFSDTECTRFRSNAPPQWKRVYQRWHWGNRVIQAMSSIQLDIQRQPCQGPDFVAPFDDYGIWNAIVLVWGRHWGSYDRWALRTAWLLLFHTVLPRDEELNAAVDAGQSDRRYRLVQLGFGPPEQGRLFDQN